MKRSFKVYKEQPWGKNVTFDNFCEYVLPYRLGDERISYWRDSLYKQYDPLLEHIRKKAEAKDPLYIAHFLIDTLSKSPHFFTSLIPLMPHAGAEITTRWKTGSCREISDAFIYICRSLGIPCGIDYVDLQGDSNGGHLWCFILDKNQKTYINDYLDPKILPAFTLPGQKTQIRRSTFSLNRELIKKMYKFEKEVHPLFKKPFFSDVTDIYNIYPHTLKIPKSQLYNNYFDSKILYVCLSSFQRWSPIAWTDNIQKDTILFPEIHGKVVLRVACWQNNRLEYLSEPFLFNEETDTLHFYKPDSETEQITLFTKCNCQDILAQNMIGGIFEGSDNHFFSPFDTLFIIKR